LEWKLNFDKRDKKNEDKKFNKMLCQELKLLYVAVTRSRYRLIVFDETNEKRKYLEKDLLKKDIIRNRIDAVKMKILDYKSIFNFLEFLFEDGVRNKNQPYQFFISQNYEGRKIS
jgi:ATP-dependent exoDNAse (exonuclease V) beta subunit